jgi:hypothetical protein
MAPCAPKRHFSDLELVPLSTDHEARVALGINTYGQAARYYLIDNDDVNNDNFDEVDIVKNSPSSSSSTSSSRSSRKDSPFQLSKEMVDCYFDNVDGDADGIDDHISPK